MKISIHFNLVKGGSTADDLPIRMRISYDGLRLDVRTGFVCHPDKWDYDQERMRPGTSNRYGETASNVNRSLSKQETVISDILARYEIDGNVPEPPVLKSDFENALGRKSRKSKAAPAYTFQDVYNKFLRQCVAMEASTVRGYVSVRSRLEDFQFFEKDPDDITMNDLYEFVNEMISDGLENITAVNYAAKIKTVLRWAKGEGLYHGTLYVDFNPTLKVIGQKDVHYLEWEEFELMLNCQLDTANKIAVRDAFCFSCATGLRVSDCSKLRWDDVFFDDAVPHINVVTKKTKKPLVIELNKWSRMIIDRQTDNSGYVFPQLSITCRNDLLPRIAKAAGIKGQIRDISYVGNRCKVSMVDKADSVTTHWGRHTFVVHALHLGISPNVIMSWTGHSSYESLKPYIAIADKTKAEKMELFDK